MTVPETHWTRTDYQNPVPFRLSYTVPTGTQNIRILFCYEVYSMEQKFLFVYSYLQNQQAYHGNLLGLPNKDDDIFKNLRYSVRSFHRDFVKPSFPESSIFPCT